MVSWYAAHGRSFPPAEEFCWWNRGGCTIASLTSCIVRFDFTSLKRTSCSDDMLLSRAATRGKASQSFRWSQVRFTERSVRTRATADSQVCSRMQDLTRKWCSHTAAALDANNSSLEPTLRGSTRYEDQLLQQMSQLKRFVLDVPCFAKCNKLGQDTCASKGATARIASSANLLRHVLGSQPSEKISPTNKCRA